MTEIFVFASNLAGRHGKGSAREAMDKHGAIYGQARGLQGRSYAIPTKDHRLQVLPLSVIAAEVQHFIAFATMHPELTFRIVAIGTGLAGIEAAIIAPMFNYAPANCILPIEFSSLMMRTAVLTEPRSKVRPEFLNGAIKNSS